MYGESFFFQAFVYLTAAVLAVPLAKRLGLGSVLGYLVAGILIGPFVLGLVGEEGQDVLHFAEFGVVMIGLELQPAALWKLRRPILGLGGLQVGLTAVALTGVGLAFGLPWQSAVAIGMKNCADNAAQRAVRTLRQCSGRRTPGSEGRAWLMVGLAVGGRGCLSGG